MFDVTNSDRADADGTDSREADFDRAASDVLTSAVLHAAAGRRLADLMTAAGAGGAGVIALSAQLDQLGAAVREALHRLPATRD